MQRQHGCTERLVRLPLLLLGHRRGVTSAVRKVALMRGHSPRTVWGRALTQQRPWFHPTATTQLSRRRPLLTTALAARHSSSQAALKEEQLQRQNGQPSNHGVAAITKVALREQPSKSAVRVGILQLKQDARIFLLESRTVDGDNWFCVRIAGGRAGWTLPPPAVAKELLERLEPTPSESSHQPPAAEKASTPATQGGARPDVLHSVLREVVSEDEHQRLEHSARNTSESPFGTLRDPVLGHGALGAGSGGHQSQQEEEDYALYGVGAADMEDHFEQHEAQEGREQPVELLTSEETDVQSTEAHGHDAAATVVAQNAEQTAQALKMAEELLASLQGTLEQETTLYPATPEERQNNQTVFGLRVTAAQQLLRHHRPLVGLDAQLDARTFAAISRALGQLPPRVWLPITKRGGFRVLCDQIAANARTFTLAELDTLTSALASLVQGGPDRGHIPNHTMHGLRATSRLRHAVHRLEDALLSSLFGGGPAMAGADADDDIDDIDDLDDEDDIGGLGDGWGEHGSSMSDTDANGGVDGGRCDAARRRGHLLGRAVLLHSLFHLDGTAVFDAMKQHTSPSSSSVQVDAVALRDIAASVKITAQDFEPLHPLHRACVNAAVESFAASPPDDHALAEVLQSPTAISALALMTTHVADKNHCRSLLSQVLLAAQHDVEQLPSAALGVIAWSLASVGSGHRPTQQASQFMDEVLRLLRMRRAILRLVGAYERSVRLGTVLEHTTIDKALMQDLLDKDRRNTLATEVEAGKAKKGPGRKKKASAPVKRSSEDIATEMSGEGDPVADKVLVTEEGVRVEFVDNRPVFPPLEPQLRFSPADMANLAYAAQMLGKSEHRAFSMLSGSDRNAMFRYRTDFPVLRLKHSTTAERLHFEIANRFIASNPSDRALGTQRARAQRQLEKLAAEAEAKQEEARAAAVMEEEHTINDGFGSGEDDVVDVDDYHGEEGDGSLETTALNAAGTDDDGRAEQNGEVTEGQAPKKKTKRRQGVRAITKEEAARLALNVQRMLRELSPVYVDRLVRDSTIVDMLQLCTQVLGTAKDEDLSLATARDLKSVQQKLKKMWGVGDDYVGDMKQLLDSAPTIQAAVEEMRSRMLKLHLSSVGGAASSSALGETKDAGNEERCVQQQEDAEGMHDPWNIDAVGPTQSGEEEVEGSMADPNISPTSSPADEVGIDELLLDDLLTGDGGSDGHAGASAGAHGGAGAGKQGEEEAEANDWDDQLMQLWQRGTASSGAGGANREEKLSQPQEAHVDAVTRPFLETLQRTVQRAEQHVNARAHEEYDTKMSKFWSSEGTLHAIYRRVDKKAEGLELKRTTKAQVLEKLLKLKRPELKQLAKGIGARSVGTKLDCARHILHHGLRLQEVEQLAHNPSLIFELQQRFLTQPLPDPSSSSSSSSSSSPHPFA